MNPPGYRNTMEGKDKEARFRHRLRLVRYAQEHGQRAAARVFRCSRTFTLSLPLLPVRDEDSDLSDG